MPLGVFGFSDVEELTGSCLQWGKLDELHLMPAASVPEAYSRYLSYYELWPGGGGPVAGSICATVPEPFLWQS